MSVEEEDGWGESKDSRIFRTILENLFAKFCQAPSNQYRGGRSRCCVKLLQFQLDQALLRVKQCGCAKADVATPNAPWFDDPSSNGIYTFIIDIWNVDDEI